jgi:hypothetical protein
MRTTHTHTSTHVTCPACGHRLTETNRAGAPARGYERAVGYWCAPDDGCGARYDLDGNRELL